MQNPYLTLSSRSLHYLLALRPSSTSSGGVLKMTTYARPCPPPINTLPVELLSYIFTLGTHDCYLEEPSSADEADRSPLFTTESVKTPLVIASVSHYWRRIAHNTPGLWTSLCISSELIRSIDDDVGVAPSSSSSSTRLLDTTHITSYLSLSRRYPLDILVDARDQDWDFFEPEITMDSDFDSYTPPFSSDHMHAVFSLLLPHLPRWRSLSILTDTWKPMHVALQCINPSITSYGAPLLETLSLMRCNDFISFSPDFQPSSMKGPIFLSSTTSQPSLLLPCDTPILNTTHILPRMRHLSLRGVHVDWTSLGEALSSSQTGGLYSLELGSHCADVRPSLSEFHHLLSANPHLRNLVISGSGPFLSGEADEVVDVIHHHHHHHNLDAVLLPHLNSLTVGYRSAIDGQTILQLVNAPNTKNLVIEDATYPADPEEIDAGSLLTYIGTGEFHDAKESYLVSYDLPNGLHYQVKTRKDSTSSIASTSTVVGNDGPLGSGIYDEEDEEDDDDDNETLVDFDTKTRVPFPLLENVTLKSVRACPSPMRVFFEGLDHLHHLELVGMSMHAVHALLPSSPPPLPPPPTITTTTTSPSSPSSNCPCPQLQSLCIRSFNNMQIQDFDFIVNKFVHERSIKGVSELKDVDIHLGPTTTTTTTSTPSSSIGIASCQVDVGLDERSITIQKGPGGGGGGVNVNVFREELVDMEIGDYGFGDGDGDVDGEDDDDDGSLVGDDTTPFEVGGAFNDPFFDAYYSTGMGWLSAR